VVFSENKLVILQLQHWLFAFKLVFCIPS